MRLGNLPMRLKQLSENTAVKDRRVKTLVEIARQHLLGRMGQELVVLPFVDELRLTWDISSSGATSRALRGLEEVDDMMLVVHLLRPGDLFVDVGANIGGYAVLASGITGCTTVAVEPLSAHADLLEINLAINGLGDRIEIVRAALGAHSGRVRMSAPSGAGAYIVDEFDGGEPEAVLGASMTTLDAVLSGRSPAVIKIDTEGFEEEVLRGATHALESPELLAVLIEHSPLHGRYGSSIEALHSFMETRGFQLFKYDAADRVLHPIAGLGELPPLSNGIYVKSLAEVADRINSAPRLCVLEKVY